MNSVNKPQTQKRNTEQSYNSCPDFTYGLLISNLDIVNKHS